MGSSAASSCAYIGDDASSMREESKQPQGRQAVRPNTNIFVIDMSRWDSTFNPITGDPIYCSDCRGIFNIYSTYTPINNEPDHFTWICEFCGNENEIRADAEELPKSESVAYILEGPTVQTSEGLVDDMVEDSDIISVIFCLDISGSMEAKAPGGQTKLECVRVAILSQIEELKRNTPGRRVILITFGNEVTVYKDSSDKVTISKPDGMTFEDCIQFAQNIEADFLTRPIRTQEIELKHTVNGLKTKGMTALGPALCVGVGLAERGTPGSKIIICTDGVANVGIGALEGRAGQSRDATAFYEQVGNYAKERGINVNVIAIEGTECKLASLSYLADFTEGNLVKVDPRKLGEDFADILADKVVACNVRATVTLHRALKFKGEDENELLFNGSRLFKDIGNITLKSTFSFEYAKKSQEELHLSEVDISDLKQIPFQILIDYKNPDGSHCLRVVTQVLKATDNLQEAERHANYDAIAANYQIRCARLAGEGRFEEWQQEDAAYRDHMMRNIRTVEHQAKFMNLVEKAEELNRDIIRHQEVEQIKGVKVDHASKRVSKAARVQVMSDSFSSKINSWKKKKF
jgi:Mg-chelatase subunit ChlD